MAGRLLVDDGFNRQVELSQEVRGSGLYIETFQVIVSFTSYETATVLRVSSEQDTVTLNLSFDDVETLYMALQEYKQAIASLASSSLGDLDEHPL